VSDSRFWIKVHDGFPEHPKTVGLSDRAFRAVVEFWCYCHRQNTDGKVPLPLFKRLPAKVRQELLADYAVMHENHIEMHDYLVHQQSSEQVKQLTETRRAAGKLGGLAKAKRVASAKQTAKQTDSKALLDIDIDIEREKERGASAPSKPSRACSLPAGFEVTEAMKSWAREKAAGIDIPAETEKFKNYHLSKGSTFKDWNAAWRTWMGKAVDYSKSNPTARTGEKKEWW